MHDDAELLDDLNGNPHLTAAIHRLPRKAEMEADSEEDACSAFGYLRGVRDRAFFLQLRFHNGNSDFFPYSWLGPFRHNPSAGLLLKFTGDVLTLVLIRGSNLDGLVNRGSVNLTDRGLQRQRISWIREMDELELRKAKPGEPTIDRIEVAEFETHEEMATWIKTHAPLFSR